MDTGKKEKSVTIQIIYQNILVIISGFLLGLVFQSFSMNEVHAKDSDWNKIDDGLFLGEFDPVENVPQQYDKIIVIKISPRKYDFRLLCSSEHNVEEMTAKEWCKRHGMIAAINAGMFLPDRKTNVGYMKNFAHINNGRINPKYHSVAAFNPVDPSNEKFKIFDADEKNVNHIIKNYNTVIQNLRLIKGPRENRWTRQDRKWSEAALGQDAKGNVLFIFSRRPFSMYEFNKVLLNLPIDIISAQHLEGGPEASLFFSHKGKNLDLVGSLETGFHENRSGMYAFGVPNVIGFSKKSE